MLLWTEKKVTVGLYIFTEHSTFDLALLYIDLLYSVKDFNTSTYFAGSEIFCRFFYHPCDKCKSVKYFVGAKGIRSNIKFLSPPVHIHLLKHEWVACNIFALFGFQK